MTQSQEDIIKMLTDIYANIITLTTKIDSLETRIEANNLALIDYGKTLIKAGQHYEISRNTKLIGEHISKISAKGGITHVKNNGELKSDTKLSVNESVPDPQEEINEEKPVIVDITADPIRDFVKRSIESNELIFENKSNGTKANMRNMIERITSTSNLSDDKLIEIFDISKKDHDSGLQNKLARCYSIIETKYHSMKNANIA